MITQQLSAIRRCLGGRLEDSGDDQIKTEEVKEEIGELEGFRLRINEYSLLLHGFYRGGFLSYLTPVRRHLLFQRITMAVVYFPFCFFRGSGILVPLGSLSKNEYGSFCLSP
jgi:hypothetical protein